MSRLFPLLMFLALPVAWVATEALGLTLSTDNTGRLFLLLLLAPLLEEWLFRHGLQEWLKLRMRWEHLPNLLTSLVFCLFHSHVGLLESFWWMVPSLALGELWRKERNLVLNTACHSWFNCCLLLAGL